ncbi:pyruvate dehydrogenase E2 component (dihydrolipoamide acetyltransferase) [Knoellia remsis]|uniref:Dihydrolipoamide acetyltransferase component of pyruvate dehydrogenase complex n=1 Tax=Knoellia remsis TaxID=407159 RepID=A0A2T0UCN5_9MICO|nr:dihydrolipoamide acetyltransferase family protein [Knoellia remsis]PRY55679.1 pyruvate dehydrogenase E2 component (dihydrolipoamide acetyltransferase) [Knoellia remsis]
MGVKQFKLPDPGEGLLEAEIVEWKVAVGDTVKVNDIVVEVETAKSLVELPIPWAGTVSEILVNVGDEVEVGTPIISIDDGQGGGATDGGGAGGAAESKTEAAGEAAVETEVPDVPAEGEEEPVKTLVGYGPKAGGSTRRARKTAASAAPTPSVPVAPSPTDPSIIGSPDTVQPDPTSLPGSGGTKSGGAGGRVLAKPPVRKLAKDLGVDLASVPATGDGGITTRADVESYAASAGSAAGAPGAAVASAGAATGSGAAGSQAGGTAYGNASGTGGLGLAEREVRVPIKGVRKMTAQAMVGSAFTAPHVTEWVTVDVTATMDLVARLKKDREFADVKVTPLLILAKAMILAARRNPEINAAWDEQAQEIVLKNYVNLGIAAATPRGLVVPNVKDADRLTLRELAAAIGELTATAREGRTQPAEMSGGTITITNVGVFGVDAGTPILNPGEAAIMAFGAVNRRPWVVTDASGEEQIVPRSVTTLALSFDHRLVDGELGSKYLADVAAILEDPTRALVWG